MSMRISLIPSATALLMLALPALAADDAQTFVNKAAIGGMFEVDSSKIAQDNAKDQQIKDFAKRMIADHGAANAKLQKIAGEQKLQVPTQSDAEHKSDLERLQSTTASLDQPYVEMQRKAHADAVGLFEAYAKQGDNPALKSFAAETLPTLKMHQDMIEKIAAASEQLVTTDLPASELGRFAELAMKARSQPVSTVSFVPPAVSTSNPDLDQIHAMVKAAVDKAEGKKKAAKDDQATGGSSRSGKAKGFSRGTHQTVGGSIGNLHDGYAANESGDLSSAC